jgi:quinolinate synthase
MTDTQISDEKILQAEVERLRETGLGLLSPDADLRAMAQLSIAINAFKKQQNAVIAGHVYQRPEILTAISDFTGDSYKLAKLCSQTDAKTIVFCGVRFMAETAKLLNPDKTVILPSPMAACTLADSITADDVRALKEKYPGLPVVTYINTTVAVKAECDCVVTSANAQKILTKLYQKHKRIIFVPDAFMGANIVATLGKKPGEDIILWKGSCVVHEHFSPALLRRYRTQNPGLKILSHTECPPEILKESDFAGGTSDMMDFIANTPAPAYMLVTECGLGELARMRFPDKTFIAMCRLCPYMKLTGLHEVLQSLENPEPAQIVQNPDKVTSEKALAALNMMFELAES